MSCKHDASRNSAGELRRGYQEVTDPRDGPGAIHPVVIRHPLSNRLGLYLGRAGAAYELGAYVLFGIAGTQITWSPGRGPAELIATLRLRYF